MFAIQLDKQPDEYKVVLAGNVAARLTLQIGSLLESVVQQVWSNASFQKLIVVLENKAIAFKCRDASGTHTKETICTALREFVNLKYLTYFCAAKAPILTPHAKSWVQGSIDVKNPNTIFPMRQYVVDCGCCNPPQVFPIARLLVDPNHLVNPKFASVYPFK